MGMWQKIAASFGPRARGLDMRDPGTWAPDDMAECVVDGPWANAFGHVTEDPARGFIAIVREVRISTDPNGRHRPYLVLSRWSDRMFDARGFRKLTPRADRVQAADALFVEQLKNRTVPSPPALPLAARLKGILP